MKSIAFQGEPGAYSEAAILEHYEAETVATIPCETFHQVFDAVTSGTCDFGFVPIENSLAGSIYQVYDLLERNTLWVIGEHFLRVSHCLIANPGSRLEDIRKVISHPQALQQCEGYLRKLPQVEVEPVYDTAGSVKIIKNIGNLGVAAIASRRAAQLYEMQILADNIEDNSANFTRFLIISREEVQPEEDAKTSIVFTMKNEPGALFKAMSVFALRNLDLTKLESRPLVGSPWNYLFYLDFAGSTQRSVVKNALASLEEFALMLRVLGSYPRQH